MIRSPGKIHPLGQLHGLQDPAAQNQVQTRRQSRERVNGQQFLTVTHSLFQNMSRMEWLLKCGQEIKL